MHYTYYIHEKIQKEKKGAVSSIVFLLFTLHGKLHMTLLCSKSHWKMYSHWKERKRLTSSSVVVALYVIIFWEDT